ncbi:TPR-like protein [Dothidotthia symphoricarpi CBS 119687]|uniref:TPR-like protein n=1 Tax=Dothidotthia symphoricarpi CBS 119687 TaxID=1392245 RepID=A0A6A6AFT5_9PLEO|nr:TPR-like protein [Dothidotthia symphoricarpi CBS 119687]KAF2130163.1 TPR-like protein [Dothidotthia symphoricarpi CBS 119687]
MASHADSAHDLLDLDIATLRQFVEFFPTEGLAKVITGYLSSGASKYPLSENTDDEPSSPDLSEGGIALNPDVPVSQEDCLVLMTEGILEARKSPLAHCLLGDYYLSLEEYESAVECTRKGLKLAAAEAKKTDLSFQRTLDALSSTLATALVYYQAPKNHPEAKEIFQSVIKRKPQFTSALIGLGLILEEEEEYEKAYAFLDQALQQDISNGRIGAEAAWCQALSGEYKIGLDKLQGYLDYPQLDASKQRGRELRAQTLYRIGVCIWELDPSKAARKDRQGAYAKLLAAIKANPNYAPAYTLLGIFYEDYNKDKKRARQCFQKAFELSPSEIVAAERLARLFANQGEWDIVEAVSQRVVDSGKARQVPGSKRKGVSWPFSSLGVVQMNKQEYQKSVVSFLSALRISPDDYYSYVGLGESYHNSGRYNSASRAFNYAENPTDGVVLKKTDGESWFTKYMLANVNRELSEYNTALEGYEAVLSQRPKEFGVSIALLQTLVEKGWNCVETGFYGEAVDSGVRAIEVAVTIIDYKPDAFNLWKAVGDACSLFSWTQEKLSKFPFENVEKLLRSDSDVGVDFDAHKDIDGIGKSDLEIFSSDKVSSLTKVLKASILAQKRAIASCVHDIHAQAVAWYNLGWTEYRAHVCLEQEANDEQKLTTYLRAAMKCFKRAIEMEAGNAEFWNSLGVITTTLNPKVAQHAFVRSLHLSDRNVHTWTNLGALYLLQNDHELAHVAFSRAQSQDPDYALAWVGEGIVALLFGDAKEALSHFTHAFELSDSSLLLTKRQYAVSAFDFLASSPSATSDITNLIQPLFALQQLNNQAPYDLPHKHLAALFLERVGNPEAAVSALQSVSEAVEQEYEKSESLPALARVVQAKTDLARNLLAAGSNESAVEEAETALDLISEFDGDAGQSTLSSEQLAKVKLSARLTAGLAHYFNGALDAAIPYFRTSLEVTSSNPDIICLLAEVLWAKGGEDERQVARDQLFTAIEKHEGHVGLLTLIGAMTVLDDDLETMEAIKDDLDRLRADKKLTDEQLARVEKVIEAISITIGGDGQALDQARRSVMLAPWKHTGWAELADAAGGDVFASTLAKETAMRNAPPNGSLNAVGLAGAMASTGDVRDAQTAIVTAPWCREGWTGLVECVQGA